MPHGKDSVGRRDVPVGGIGLNSHSPEIKRWHTDINSESVPSAASQSPYSQPSSSSSCEHLPNDEASCHGVLHGPVFNETSVVILPCTISQSPATQTKYGFVCAEFLHRFGENQHPKIACPAICVQSVAGDEQLSYFVELTWSKKDDGRTSFGRFLVVTRPLSWPADLLVPAQTINAERNVPDGQPKRSTIPPPSRPQVTPGVNLQKVNRSLRSVISSTPEVPAPEDVDVQPTSKGRNNNAFARFSAPGYKFLETFRSSQPASPSTNESRNPRDYHTASIMDTENNPCAAPDAYDTAAPPVEHPSSKEMWEGFRKPRPAAPVTNQTAGIPSPKVSWTLAADWRQITATKRLDMGDTQGQSFLSVIEGFFNITGQQLVRSCYHVRITIYSHDWLINPDTESWSAQHFCELDEEEFEHEWPKTLQFLQKHQQHADSSRIDIVRRG